MDVFNRKILIIGLDGATWDILDQVMEDGYMPYLRKMRDNGSFGILKSTIPPISPSAWGTIQTGKEALNNHIYEFYTFNKNSKKIKLINSEYLNNTIWEILSKVGKTVGVVNIPVTYPPKKVNGYIVSGILTPSLDVNFTHPPELKEQILNKIPNYQLKYQHEKRYGNPLYNIKDFISQRIKNVKDRTKVCIYLLHNYKIDILMVNFQAHDILQHTLWAYLDKNHVKFNKKLQDYIFKRFHKVLDYCIETIREEFIRTTSGDHITITLSDHGFETHYKQFYLGDWLKEKRLLTVKKNIIKSIIRRNVRNIILKLNLPKIQLKLINFLKSKSKGLKKPIIDGEEIDYLQNLIDWDNSYVISKGIGLYGYIFIFKEGKDRDILINYLKTKLYQIRDPENGNRLIEKIYTKEELYTGNQPDIIPDLIIKPNKGYSITGMIKGKKRLFEKVDLIKDSEAIGKHNENGIIIMNGNLIKKEKIKNAHLKDIVPTILDYFGLPTLEDLDGNSLNYFK